MLLEYTIRLQVPSVHDSPAGQDHAVVQGPALWPERSTTSLHKDHETHHIGLVRLGCGDTDAS